LHPAPKTILPSSRQSTKHDLSITSIDEGRHSEDSDRHDEKANAPMFEMRERDSNVNFPRLQQELKEKAAIVSTDEGIQIDSSDSQRSNADSPIIER
jgi:hypothetical protein